MARPGKRVRRDCPSPHSEPSSATSSTKGISRRAMEITPPPSPSLAVKTAKHLREAGWRDFVAVELTEESTFCGCAAPESKFHIEDAIRCFNRNCKIEYFHLTCMNIPDHPPRGIGWMCPTCRKKGSGAEVGLYDLRHFSGGMAWKEWLVEERRKKDILRPGGEISRKFGTSECLDQETTVAPSESVNAAATPKRKREVEEEQESSDTVAGEDPRFALAAGDLLYTLAAKEGSSLVSAAEEGSSNTLAAEEAETDDSASSELTEFDSEDE